MYVIISYNLDITIFESTLNYINNLNIKKITIFLSKKYSILK